MKYLMILVAFTLGVGAVSAYDWDPLGDLYPDDVRGVPLPAGDARELYVSPDNVNAGTGLFLNLKEARRDENYPRKKNLVAFLDTDWWGAGAGISLEFQVQTMSNMAPLSETNTFRIPSQGWTRTRAFLPVSGAEEWVHFVIKERKDKGVKGKLAFYEPRVSLEENLLSDGDGEQMPLTQHGWVQVSGDWSTPRKPEIQQGFVIGGSNLIWPGRSDVGILEQTVPVERFRDYLNGPEPLAVLGGNVATYSGDHDTAEMVLESLDALGSVLASATTGALDHDIWMFKSVAVPLAPETKSVRVRLIGRRDKGKDNNAYFDSLALVLPGSGPPAQYKVNIPLVDMDAASQQTASGGPSLDDIARQLEPLPTFIFQGNRWTTTLTITEDQRRFFDSRVPIFAYRYRPDQGEKIDVNAEKQGDKILILTERGTLIQKDFDMQENHVMAHLLPHKVYTVFVFDNAANAVNSYALTVHRVAEANVGSEEEALTAYFENPRVYLQKYDFPPSENDYDIAADFIKLNHHVDGKPLRVFRLEAKAGQKVTTTANPANLGVTIYDAAMNVVADSMTKEGSLSFTAARSGVYWVAVSAPRVKWYKAFDLRIQKSRG